MQKTFSTFLFPYPWSKDDKFQTCVPKLVAVKKWWQLNATGARGWQLTRLAFLANVQVTGILNPGFEARRLGHREPKILPQVTEQFIHRQSGPKVRIVTVLPLWWKRMGDYNRSESFWVQKNFSRSAMLWATFVPNGLWGTQVRQWQG